MYKVLEVPPAADLSQFSRYLWQQKISHRIFSLDEAQVLAVAEQEDVPQTADLYERWQRGELTLGEDSDAWGSYIKPGQLLLKFFLALLRAPVTGLLLILSLAFALATQLGDKGDVVRIFLFPDFSYGGSTIYLDQVLSRFSLSQFLRMLSPVVLHFSILHLAFNMLWLWELGKRIEALQSKWSMLLLVLILALISNTAQYIFGGSVLFGGMSGVVYGLFGYIWMWQLFDPARGLGLPRALVFFILLTLLLMTWIGFENIADAAHVGGFLTGVVYGAALATVSRVRRSLRAGGKPLG